MKQHFSNVQYVLQYFTVIAPPEEGAAATALTEIQRRINTHTPH